MYGEKNILKWSSDSASQLLTNSCTDGRQIGNREVYFRIADGKIQVPDAHFFGGQISQKMITEKCSDPKSKKVVMLIYRSKESTMKILKHIQSL